jgi:hypothetical protein
MALLNKVKLRQEKLFPCLSYRNQFMQIPYFFSPGLGYILAYANKNNFLDELFESNLFSPDPIASYIRELIVLYCFQAHQLWACALNASIFASGNVYLKALYKSVFDDEVRKKIPLLISEDHAAFINKDHETLRDQTITIAKTTSLINNFQDVYTNDRYWTICNHLCELGVITYANEMLPGANPLVSSSRSTKVENSFVDQYKRSLVNKMADRITLVTEVPEPLATGNYQTVTVNINGVFIDLHTIWGSIPNPSQ